jgi:hypothetical protein
VGAGGACLAASAPTDRLLTAMTNTPATVFMFGLAWQRGNDKKTCSDQVVGCLWLLKAEVSFEGIFCLEDPHLVKVLCGTSLSIVVYPTVDDHF